MPEQLILNSVDELFDDQSIPRALLTASPHVELSWLPNSWIVDVAVRYEPPASLVAEALVIIGTAGVTLAELGPVRVQLIPAPEDDRPLLVRITLGLQPVLALYDLRLAVELTQPWLHRVDPVTWRPTTSPFRFEIDGALRIAIDGSTDFQAYGLSIPPVEIGDTGIVIALDDCQLAVDGTGVPVSLRDLLASTGTTEFDGIYARRARLSWLPQFRFPGANLPGFSFDFHDVLLDGNGISFTLSETWNVERLAEAAHRLSPRCAMLGRLFGDRLRIAFEHATGTVVQNDPVGFRLDAWIEIPPLQALLKAGFEVAYDPEVDGGLINLALAQDAGSVILVDLGVGTLQIENFSAEGLMRDDSLEVNGSGRFAVELPGWTSGPLDVEATFAAGQQQTSLSFDIRDLNLGPLGAVSQAEFSLTFASDTDGVSSISEFGIKASFEWRDLAAQLGFSNLPPNLPLPPDDAHVSASIVWTAAGSLILSLEAAAGDATTIFAFLPPAFRPQVRSVAFGFRAVFSDATDFFASQPGGSISGEIFARLSFRPSLSPALRDNGVIELKAGDEEGFIAAELRATIDEDGSSELSLDVESPVTIEVTLPGLTDGPLFVTSLTQASVTLQDEVDSQTSATINLSGEYGVLPASLAVSSMIAPPIAAFLEPLMNLAVRGSVAATLQLNEDRAALTLSVTLSDAQIEIDLFEQIGRLAAGPGGSNRAEPASQRQSRQELDLDLSLRFALDGLKLQVGQLEDAFGEQLPASVELHFTAGLAGATLPAFVRLSSEELAIGVEGAEVPLRLPSFPLTPADLQAPLAGADGRWTIGGFQAAVAQLQAQIDGGGGPLDRDAAARRGLLMTKVGMLRFIQGVWTSLSSDDARATYQDGVVALIAVLDAVSGITHTNSNVHLKIENAQIRIPFDDPRSTAVEGNASLSGFAEDDPLHGLEDLTLRLGLSPDQIYFGLEASGEPIPLPPVGRYVNGHVSVSQLTIGYGFTRNSLAMSFAGELVYPEHLTEDVNTSRTIGFGLKLPRYNQLAFRLDMIPVPGPIPLVPAFEFALDLRTPGVPALSNTQTCAPAFDGLELDVPGVVHADIKAISASPLFGIIPAVNVRFDGDLDLGNDQFGLTIVCDDLLWLAGIGTSPTPMPVPFLIDPMAPYFEHLCVNLRCAGFGINFDLERPFPLPNPLLIFEVLALIADPLTPIDPDGVLARSIRIALRDAYISIPRWARALIPGGAQLVRNEINLELNVGTLITAAQWVARTIPPVLKQVQDAFAAGTAALQNLTASPPDIDPGELLALLPPELRMVHCELSFAGFDASASLILITPEDAGRDNAAVNDLWQLPALLGFSRDDLQALAPPAGNSWAILAVAQIELLNVASYRSFGRLSDDGTFALATGLRVAPLQLSINGFTVQLPLQFEGRLALLGQITDRRRFAAVHAMGTGRWDIVPGILRVSAGVKKPVELRLNSNGRFAISGDGAVDFFGGALKITGMLDASESHLAVTGEMNFSLGGTQLNPALELRASGGVHLGPGPKWGFDGRGELRLFDLTFANAAVNFNEREVSLHLAIARRRWRLGQLQFDTHVSGEFDGRISFPQNGSPGLRLRGRGKIEALGGKLTGSLAVQADDHAVRVAAEGELIWFNKPWFAARIALGSDGSAEFAGRTSVALDLTPTDLPAGIQVASLFLRADFAARFTFDRSGEKLEHEIDIDWSLGIRLPGGAPGQTFVLAMQKMHVAAHVPLDVELINVQGINFVPLSDLVLPIPEITFGGTEQVIRARINLPVIDQVRFMMTDGMRVDLEDLFQNEDFIDKRVELFKVPKNLKVEIKNQKVGDWAVGVGFRVHLQWSGGRLGFEIKRGVHSRFIGFEDLL